MKFFYLVFCTVIGVKAQVNLEEYFGNCDTREETFDDCVKNGLNNLRPYYQLGLKDYNVDPFDPFFAEQIPQKRSNPLFNYKLVLKNVTESGWTQSEITKFSTDFNKNTIKYTQFFPDKRLDGWYEIEGAILGTKINNKGNWNLALYNFTQSTDIVRKPIRDAKGEFILDPPLKVNVHIQTCKKLELHIGHLAGGRTVVENMLDWVINSAWQPGFMVLKPVINDLVSTAFTEIFNKNFQNFPFETIFPD